MQNLNAGKDLQLCPVCKEDSFMNPKIVILVSPCYHRACKNCVDRLFISGTAPCPVCSTSLNKSSWNIPRFEDLRVEKECRIRKQLSSTFNKIEEDFEDLRAYNDYLEQVEDIIESLVDNKNVLETQKKIEAYRKENRSLIRKRAAQHTQMLQQERAEIQEEVRQRHLYEESLMKEVQMASQMGRRQQEQFIERLSKGQVDLKRPLMRGLKDSRSSTRRKASPILPLEGLEESKIDFDYQSPLDSFLVGVSKNALLAGGLSEQSLLNNISRNICLIN